MPALFRYGFVATLALAALACGEVDSTPASGAGGTPPLDVPVAAPTPDASIPPVTPDASPTPPVPPKPDAAPPPDAGCTATEIAGRLACIPGLTVKEIKDGDDGVRVPAGYRRFDLMLDQPVDHANPAGQRFEQRLSLLHKDEAAPFVLASSGYGLSTGRSEITRLFEANQLQVEHRFFPPSQPQTPTWQHHNIKQSADDYHRIATALRPIYRGKWVNTGASKGGMTSVYHRRFYPTDLDATVAYVAPTVQGERDPRFIAFTNAVGGAAYAACRAKIAELQKTALTRKAEITARMTGSFTILGSKEIALEHAVLELPFVFWQYTNPASTTSGCAAIPAPTAPIQTLYRFFSQVTQLNLYGDDGVEYFQPYYYQAATQLGAPGVDDTEILPLMQHRATYSSAAYAPAGVPITFDAQAMVDVDNWVATQGSELMFIYGEYDPWSAGKYVLGQAKDSFVYTAPGANHGASINSLAATDRAAALDTLERWLGATVIPSLRRGHGADDPAETPRRRPRL